MSVEATYQELFGRAPDAAGLAHWQGTGLTGDALKSTILANAAPDDRKAFLGNSYQTMFGRAAETPDLNYWAQDNIWTAKADGGVDLLNRRIADSSVGSDEYALLENLGADQGRTWSANLYAPNVANDLWSKLMDPDGLNPRMLAGELPRLPEIPEEGAEGGEDTGPNTYQDYLNPYLGEVLDNAVRRVEEQEARRQNQLGSMAFANGAYGDARHAIESDLLTETTQRNIGDLSSQIHAQGFESAYDKLNRDLDRSANVAFQNAALQNTWQANNANLANQGNQIGLDDFGATGNYLGILQNLDNYDRNWVQNQLNADYTDFWSRQNWDERQVTGLLNTLNSVPNRTSTTSGTAPNTDWANSLGSFLQSALGGGSGTSSVVPAVG